MVYCNKLRGVWRSCVVKCLGYAILDPKVYVLTEVAAQEQHNAQLRQCFLAREVAEKGLEDAMSTIATERAAQSALNITHSRQVTTNSSRETNTAHNHRNETIRIQKEITAKYRLDMQQRVETHRLETGEFKNTIDALQNDIVVLTNGKQQYTDKAQQYKTQNDKLRFHVFEECEGQKYLHSCYNRVATKLAALEETHAALAARHTTLGRQNTTLQEKIKTLEVMKEEARHVCAICYEGKQSKNGAEHFLTCGHTFHKTCLDMIPKSPYDETFRCPSCRGLTKTGARVLYVFTD